MIPVPPAASTPQHPWPASFWVTARADDPPRLLGSQFPGATEPEWMTERLGRLLDLDVRTLVCLQPLGERGRGGDLFPDHLTAFERLAATRALAVTTHRLPITDMGVPAPDLMRGILDAIAEGLLRSRVLVHCWGGHGRTGTVLGCWLREQGLDGEAALATLAAARRHHNFGQPAPQTDDQRRFIHGWSWPDSKRIAFVSTQR